MSATIHRCIECAHQSADHLGPNGWGGGARPRSGGFCSQGGCACILSRAQVESRNPAVEVPTFPAYAPKAGRRES